MEEWKGIPGWPGYYVSNCGRIYREEQNYITIQGKHWHLSAGFLHIRYNKYNGYAHVSLGVSGNRREQYIHRLVASAFIGNIPDGYEIDHIDTNKLNNCVDNLRIVTRKDNVNNPLSILHLKQSCIGKKASEDTKRKMSEKRKGKKRSDSALAGIRKYVASLKRPVLMLSLDGAVLRTFPSATDAAIELGFSRASINGCCLGNNKTAYGYKWKYK